MLKPDFYSLQTLSDQLAVIRHYCNVGFNRPLLSSVCKHVPA